MNKQSRLSLNEFGGAAWGVSLREPPSHMGNGTRAGARTDPSNARQTPEIQRSPGGSCLPGIAGSDQLRSALRSQTRRRRPSTIPAPATSSSRPRPTAHWPTGAPVLGSAPSVLPALVLPGLVPLLFLPAPETPPLSPGFLTVFPATPGVKKPKSRVGSAAPSVDRSIQLT